MSLSCPRWKCCLPSPLKPPAQRSVDAVAPELSHLLEQFLTFISCPSLLTLNDHRSCTCTSVYKPGGTVPPAKGLTFSLLPQTGRWSGFYGAVALEPPAPTLEGLLQPTQPVSSAQHGLGTCGFQPRSPPVGLTTPHKSHLLFWPLFLSFLSPFNAPLAGLGITTHLLWSLIQHFYAFPTGE